MVKRQTKTKSKTSTTSKQGATKPKQLTYREIRSAAAKKGWETRRANQAGLKSLDEKRRSAKQIASAIAKKMEVAAEKRAATAAKKSAETVAEKRAAAAAKKKAEAAAEKRAATAAKKRAEAAAEKRAAAKKKAEAAAEKRAATAAKKRAETAAEKRAATAAKKRVEAASKKQTAALAKKMIETAAEKRAVALAKKREQAKRRSEASKKGWITRKAKETERKKEAQYDLRAPLLERKDLRPTLAKKFDELKDRSEQTLEETRKKLVKEDKAKLRSLSFLDLLNQIRSPRLRLEAEYSGSIEAALEIGYKDVDLYWDVQIEKTRKRQQLSRDATLTHYNKHIYGTEMEAYNMVDDTFRILCAQYGAEETEESKLRKFLNEAYATPQFNSIMTVKAGDIGCSTHDLYSWFNGSPNADLFI